MNRYIDSLQRKLGERKYRKLFIVFTEGEQSEILYFNMLKRRVSNNLKIICKSGKHSSPESVLKSLRDYITSERISHSYESWIIIDRDFWTEEHLYKLMTWQTICNYNHVAVSNPKFEYWLLLHFDDAKGIQTVQECENRLKRFIKDYDKRKDYSSLLYPKIHDAIERAKKMDTPIITTWPKKAGTTVYRLVEKIISKE